ncbi:MAG TPA: zf-HC2 domain-containing protein [Gemmatimonadaceae bacterium]|nr:zf-HC2 domain-containing protein [Gemmatimonadaceae bacterium]
MPTDCSSIEMRELLPELLHDALPAPERERVEAHLAVCESCAAEFAVLRSARRAFAGLRVPAVDTAGIVAALPRPVAPAGRRPQPARRSPMLFRLAAAITFISLGGISVAVVRSFLGDAPATAVDSVMAWKDDSLSGMPTLARADTPRAASRAYSGLAVHPSISDLGDADLESLLGELDQLEAAPLAEPEVNPGGRALDGAIIGS